MQTALEYQLALARLTSLSHLVTLSWWQVLLSVVVLVLAAVCIVVMVVWLR